MNHECFFVILKPSLICVGGILSMAKLHSLGFRRVGQKRELKFLLERFWRGEITEQELLDQAKVQRRVNWELQSALDFVTVGDFSLYDHVLDTSFLLGHLPKRAQGVGSDLDQYFCVARGRSTKDSLRIPAGEMTKWFDTNYHYIVPELDEDTSFQLNPSALTEQIREAKELNKPVKVVLVGPLTYLWLSKSQSQINKLDWLSSIVRVYRELLGVLDELDVDWVQFDEPILVTELEDSWKKAFSETYDALSGFRVKRMVATYFGELQDNVSVLKGLFVDGFHIDCVRGKSDRDALIELISDQQVLSLGVIDGRNVWASDLTAILKELMEVHETLNERLWLAPSCSLLHVPVDLSIETDLCSEIRPWMSFAVQKIEELQILGEALQDRLKVADALQKNQTALESRRSSSRTRNEKVREALQSYEDVDGFRKTAFPERKKIQASSLKLPLFPTTTIGSFPQTSDIRSVRRSFKNGDISEAEYVQFMKDEISQCIQKQEDMGLDVLVHGEAERNDMVEYFGEQLEGFVFTRFGWVQSYGSRCVKPPIIYGDVYRPNPMTVEWIQYAQSQTEKPVKGMLTGPVTILNWSFVRDDQPRSETCLQLAVALRDEVEDLEKGNVTIIQIDEAALREGLPLRQAQWQDYLAWTTRSFRIMAGSVLDSTQIHTHMCYSDFNDIMEAIADMDADVITIETSRSHMELLKAFEQFRYPNDIGPGVYDIHSPNVPNCQDIYTLIEKAIRYIPVEQLWVNPDCGLKTRQWEEVEPALKEMVSAAQLLRKAYV